ncbi:MAG TPA: GGDEF domain-containing protein [Candidatus Polarisedimenticolaceae bacterium]|nr:GGDEF domain-containing protein [Candidatus Polarisedimenticolaceae bacterium]
MALRILVLGPIAPGTLEALARVEPGVEVLPPAAAHDLLTRIATDEPQLVVHGTGAFDWAGSSSLLHQVLDSEFARATRYRHPLSILLLAVDHLDALVETHGTAALDEWRRGLAEGLRRSLRQIDVIARTGANEIAILLPETTGAGARVVAERARALASRLLVKGELRRALPVKASVSVGLCDAPRDGLESSAGFLDAARASLRRAVEAGGDRVAPSLA